MKVSGFQKSECYVHVQTHKTSLYCFITVALLAATSVPFPFIFFFLSFFWRVSIHCNTLFFGTCSLAWRFKGFLFYFLFHFWLSKYLWRYRLAFVLFHPNISLNFNGHRKILRGFFGRQLIEFFRFKIFKKCGNSPLDGSDSLALFF
jgi:hypothetical protein